MTVADDPGGEPTDDVSVVTVESEISKGEAICVNTFESDAWYEGKVRVSRSWNANDNVIDGKISWFQVYRPSDPTYTTKVTSGPIWDNPFSEEGAALSYDTPRPIIGLYCSQNYCDEKR